MNDEKAVQVCLFCHNNETYAPYLMDPCTLCKTNFYKDTILLNELVKQQQEMIISRDNIIQTQKLHISHLEKQISKNVPTYNLLDLD